MSVLPDVTDRAVLTYLEEVWGLDIARLRREIGRQALPVLGHPGARAVRQGKHQFFVEGGVVTGVLKVCKPCRRTGRQRNERPDTE
jgi:hypothetical protein